MRCNVRGPDGNKFPLVIDRVDKVKVIRQTIAKELNLDAAKVRLIYLGKQLEDSLSFYDYDVKDNDTILAFERVNVADLPAFVSPTDPVGVLPTPSSASPAETKSSEAPASMSEADQEAILAAQEEAEKCKKCNNTSEAECKECGCNVCGKKNNESMILICDECQYYFHMYCLPTPMTEVPDGDWYCHGCFNDPTKIIGAGDSSKIKTKKGCGRKWDNGMACAGVLKKCTIVKPDHVGAIPGVPVGSSYRYRVHLSESGIHRPPVSGIHGSSKTRAVSIVLAGGYVDDKDYGDHFFYTGSGGRDLSGNKRTAQQSMDQELTRSNLALALTMNMPINDKEGAVAKDWKKSSPVRVTRSYKLAKESKFAPTEGIRYDGLYKLVRYWPEPGQNGFLVWRYEFRRDDPEPAPWTIEGKKAIEELGLTMYIPEGYVVPNSKSEKDKAKPKAKAKAKGKGRGRKSVKKEEESSEEEEEEEEVEKVVTPAPKKAKVVAKSFKPRPETLNLVAQDLLNARTWQLILNNEYPSETAFLEAIMSKEFMCPICHDQVTEPVSTRCGHNACRPCLKQSLLGYGNLCPMCRGVLYPELNDIGKAEAEKELKSIANGLSVNKELVAILKHLIPSYGS